MESLMTSLLTLVNVIIVVVVFHSEPLVCSASLEYSINEELPVGTIVANIRNDAGWLREKHSPEVFNSLRFAILHSGSVTTSYFAIDDVSGQIRIKERIDREAVCHDKPMTSCVLRVDFGVRPANYFEIIRSEFTIMDVNDNAPSFETGSSFKLTISETSPVGSTFDIPSAKDIDIDDNGNIDYKLRDESKEENFRLVVSRSRKSGTNADDVKLQQVRALDRERRSEYRLTLVASDRGHVTKLVETLVINVVVSDVNDNAPRFERQSYEIAAPEDAPIGMTVVRMQATDADSGDNAQIRYRFSTRTQSIYGDTFAIDPTTGDVVLLQSLAYGSDDPVTTYQLSVVAEDSGQFPTPAHASLVVKVIDVNDHSPRISIDTSSTNSEHSSSSYAQPEVAEHSPPGTFVGHVTVTDADSGSNGIVHCELVLGSPDKRQVDFQLVYVYEGEYQLLTAREFDRETSGLHFAAIRCADGGTPARLTTRNITVIITDTNDNAPTFSKDVYEVTVPENSPWGTVVTRLSASDMDLGDNGHITYLLDRRDKAKLASGRRFHVDPDTGVITTLVGLDRERTDVIEFNVLATDAGKQANGRQVAHATVRVHVSDVDDESPKFVDSEHAFSVEENLPVGTRVGQVTAVDLDAPPYNAFSYRLRSADVEPDAAFFHIDAGTGIISTAAVLDRESRLVYRLSVVAQSDTVRARSDVSSVTIRLVDTNDNQPTFIFPNDVNDTAFVAISSILAASASSGHVIVATCEATDADEGVNSLLSYDIIDDDGAHPGLFRIDKVSGRLTMMTNFLTDRNGNISQSLMIRASDDGSPSLSAVQTLHVVIVEGGDVINYDYADWMKSLASNSDRNSDVNNRYQLHIVMELYLFITAVMCKLGRPQDAAAAVEYTAALFCFVWKQLHSTCRFYICFFSNSVIV